MNRTLLLSLVILCASLLVGFNTVPWLEFPDDIKTRGYKIGNVVTGTDPDSLDAIIAAFEVVDDLSQGGVWDHGVITVPAWVSWDGIVPQTDLDFVQAVRIITNENVDIHFVVDPLPHRTYLGDQVPPPPGTSFADPAVRQAFQDYTLDVMVRLHPEYVTLGAEVNMFYHGAAASDFIHLNSLINETADLVRAISPETRIMTTIQWEHLHHFISAGGWEPIEEFEWNIDILGLSSFPMTLLQYYDPSRLPWWYYMQVFLHYPPNHTPETLAIAISEIGFPSRPEYETDGSEKMQSNGIVTLVEQAAQFPNLELVNYWYLHDHDRYFRQTSYGLIESITTEDGTAGRRKPAYYMWEKLGKLRYEPF